MARKRKSTVIPKLRKKKEDSDDSSDDMEIGDGEMENWEGSDHGGSDSDAGDGDNEPAGNEKLTGLNQKPSKGKSGSKKKDVINGDEDEDDGEHIRAAMATRQKNLKKKSGGFQSMGLSPAVFKGIMKYGYKVPTPIQRKTIPVILDNKDVVAMARTGSGKSAAFLIPMLENLRSTAKNSVGARALIITPTRELALQTLQFTKELGKFTDLKATIVLGGDKMTDQFEALHGNPDIIIATPGRLLHVVMEMNLKLASVQYVVFDEADRLFELGFKDQLQEILHRLTDQRQTVLFSATLPKMMIDFARAGLNDPTLIRLDVETKLSENLTMNFLKVRTEDKTSLLVHFLKNIVQPNEQTLVFVATKHHVEYLHMLLSEAGIPCGYLYSALDSAARKINIGMFRNKKISVLLVTDLAARGIDIPLLDNVINYNFPGKPKLFVHRVGRVARAGSSGTAYSFVSFDELAYVLDLHLFLGKSLKLAKKKPQKDNNGLYGSVPHAIIDEEDSNLHNINRSNEFESAKQTADNAYKQYIKSRPPSSLESLKRAKILSKVDPKMHPMFAYRQDAAENVRLQFLDSMRKYRPKGTIFEVNPESKKESYSVMQAKRQLHDKRIVRPTKGDDLEDSDDEREAMLKMGTENEIQNAFGVVIQQKPTKQHSTKKDTENYIEYQPKDFISEKGLSIGGNFHDDATKASLDVMEDDGKKMSMANNKMRWDRKRKRFTGALGNEANVKKIQTESGAVIAASYKKNIYGEWLRKHHVATDTNMDEEGEDYGESDFDKAHAQVRKIRGCRFKPGGLNMPAAVLTKKAAEDEQKYNVKRDGTLKSKEEIVRDRIKKMKNIAKHNARLEKKSKGVKKGRNRKTQGRLGVPTSDFKVISLPLTERKKGRKSKLFVNNS